MKLRVMSWNLFFCLGAPNHSFDTILKGITYPFASRERPAIQHIAKLIGQHKPHVLAIQEADFRPMNKGHDQIQELQNITNMNYAIRAQEKNTFGVLNDGNALLSTLPHAHSSTHILPYNLEKRNFIHVQLTHPKIHIICTHLGAHSFNKSERIRQMEALAKHIQPLKGSIILLGDFNCNTGSEENNLLIKRTQLTATIQQNTYPVHNPTQSFDQIFISKHIKLQHAKVLPNKLSDHLPVFVEILVG